MAALAAALLAGCAASSMGTGTSGGGRPGAAQGAGAGAAEGAGASTPQDPEASAARSHVVDLSVPAANRSGAFTTTRAVSVPAGWTVEVWALVPNARLEQWTPQGALLVSEPSDGRVLELTPAARRSAPPSQRVILSGLNQPQGLAFDHVGGREVLYVAETDGVDRYVWHGDHVGARTVLIPHLPSGSDHTLKNVVVGRHHDLYVDIGSTANASPSPPSNPPFASVVKYTAAGRRIRIWATGVRNGDGLSIAPDGSLWTAVNERDDIAYPFHGTYAGHADAYGQVIPAYVNNHPSDEIAKLTAGRNLGWPYCDPDPDVSRGAENTRFKYQDLRFDVDVQTNPGGDRLDCARLAPLNLGLPAHSAPLGFHFLRGSRLPKAWRAGAIVAIHGSWDRQPPRAPAVLWMRWNAKRHTLETARSLITGFQDASGNRWGRPVDAVPGPDGALYVSDDAAGAVYRVVP